MDSQNNSDELKKSTSADSTGGADTPAHGGMPASAPSGTADSPFGPAPGGVVAPQFGAASSMGAPKPAGRRKAMMISMIVGGAVLVLGGGAAAAYYGYVVPNKPANILKAALANSFSGKVKSEHFDGKLDVTDKSSATTVGATFKGGADASTGAFDVNLDVSASALAVNAEVLSTDGQSLYFKVSNLDGVKQLLDTQDASISAVYGPILDAINNQWISIDQAMLKQMGINTDTGFKVTDADRQKLADAYKAHPFLTVGKKLADEKISGMNSVHLTVVVDKQQLKDLLAALKDAKLSSMNLTSDQLAAADKSIDAVDFSKFPLDVWVDKSSKQVDQISFSYSNSQATVNIRFTIDDYKPVTVTKPANAKTLLELITQIETSGGAATQGLLQGSALSGISL